MNDETKAAVEDLRRLVSALRQNEPMRLILAHIDGEPARLAAALENLREACARFCEEEYYDVPQSECAFADSLEAIRATPLDATPLADLEAECDRLSNDARQGLANERALHDALLWAHEWHLRELPPPTRVTQAAIERIAELQADQHCPTCGSSVYTCVDCDVTPLRARVAELEADIAVGRETCRRHGTAPSNVDEATKWPASRLIGLLSHNLAGRKAAVDDAMAVVAKARDRAEKAEAQVAAARAVCARHRENPFMGTQAALSHVLRAMDEAAKEKL